jgi:hypothetical protein
MGFFIGYLGLNGSEKAYRPAYINAYLKTYEMVSEKIMTSPDSSHISAAVDILISFIPSHADKEKMYSLKRKYFLDAVKEAEADSKRKLTDNEAVALQRSSHLRVVAEVNEIMSATLGFAYSRRVGIIGEFGDAQGFVSDKDLPEDIRAKMMERLNRVDYDDEVAETETLADEGQAEAEDES